MSTRRFRLTVGLVLVLSLAGASIALARGGSSRDDSAQLSAHLIGYNEVPALNTAGHADFTATMTSDQIVFRLDYADLTGPPLVAHIHVGQKNVTGGVSIFFCGGPKPPCPASPSGTVTGTITAADVIGPVGQGFTPGDLASVEKAIRAGVTYANMHTSKFPAGEIRGQIAVEESDGND